MLKACIHQCRVVLSAAAGRLLLAFSLLSGSAGAVSACDADSILGLFEQSLPQGQVTRLKYHKDARSLLFGERAPESGTIWLGPPKRYRVEAERQVIVRGDDTLWSYTPQTKQVTLQIGNLDSLEFGPAGFFGSLRADFFAVDCAPDTLGEVPVWRVRLAAKTEAAAIQRLALWIDPGTHRAHSAEYVDYNEETARLTFTDYQIEKDNPTGRFGFVCPKGVERIVLPVSKDGQTNNDHK